MAPIQAEWGRGILGANVESKEEPPHWSSVPGLVGPSSSERIRSTVEWRAGVAGRQPDRALSEPRPDSSPPTEVAAGFQCMSTTTLSYRAAPPYPPNHSWVSIGGGLLRRSRRRASRPRTRAGMQNVRLMALFDTACRPVSEGKEDIGC